MTSRRPIALAALMVLVTIGCASTDDTQVSATEQPRGTQPAATAPADTALPEISGPVVITEPSPGPSSVAYAVVQVDGEVTDPARARSIPYRVYAPADRDGPVPLILVSHGGFGSDTGYTRGGHLGSTFAAGGFVAIHIGHRSSTETGGQLADRPADVSFVLDQLEVGGIVMPDGFVGSVDLSRVGHTGHSYGAYTAHTVGGGTFRQPTEVNYRDERIDAIAPISPQGPGQFGAFDLGADDNTWRTVEVPVYNLIGGDELTSNALGDVKPAGWRQTPFDRYPGTADTFETIIAGQTHGEMWNEGTVEVEQFVASQILTFMRIYVAGDVGANACTLAADATSGTLTLTSRRAAGGESSQIAGC